MNQISDEDLS